MERPPTSTAELLAQALSGCPTASIDAIAGALEEGRITTRAGAVRLRALRGVDDRTAERVAGALARSPQVLDSAALATALRVASRMREIERAKAPQVEIAWTGPEAGGPLVRPTALVIEEMLDSVTEAGEILIVGYSLTADDGSPTREVIARLSAASRKRAVIRVVLHHDGEERNRKALLDAWDTFAVKPRIYTWLPATGGPYRKLHAKVLVVDRLQALVTSANLTYHGLKENLEIGLRIWGPQARTISEKFDHLIAESVLVEWTDSG